ncbi:MAG: hypothetical protein JNK82_12615 [Myxococcaceae bacterium]|nr:hypothetical protein [Myxococcaceae bacterium]
MLLTLLTTAMLASAPVDAPKFSWRLSVGSFIGSAWAAPSFRQNVERLQTEQLATWRTGVQVFDSPYLVYATPVLGPWLTLIRGGEQARDDMWLLLTSGVLQGIGITALAYRVIVGGESSDSKNDGLVLDISPYVAGRLGLSLTLTGW